MPERENSMAVPRVTFAVLGYNQEHFIGDAIAGALTQDYPNLEVVLSDDGSSDRTYELMQAARESYTGPHHLVVNRTPANVGTLGHVHDILRKSSGDLLVLAAGDDISYPHRVSRLVYHWLRTGADALCSKYDVINETGAVIERDYVFPVHRFEFQDYFPDQQVTSIHGASSAYARRLLEQIEFPSGEILFEDTFFTLMIHRRGGLVHFVDEALVKYRRHGESSTNSDYRRSDAETVRRRELASQRMASSLAAVLQAFRDSLGRFGSASRIDTRRLGSDLRFYLRRAKWSSASAAERFRALVESRRRDHAVWAAARLFGLRAFVRLKGLQAIARRLAMRKMHGDKA
jgi:cellulose synthase/poly-beta-1,6-N-acetylglucosamine synthase-like glycosyltransferase